MVPYTKFLVFMIKIMRSLIYHEGITSSSCCDRRPHSFTKYWRFLAKKSRTFWRVISGPFERGCWTRFKLSKTLEEFWNLIYEVQKEYYSGPYPHPLKKKGSCNQTEVTIFSNKPFTWNQFSMFVYWDVWRSCTFTKRGYKISRRTTK